MSGFDVALLVVPPVIALAPLCWDYWRTIRENARLKVAAGAWKTAALEAEAWTASMGKRIQICDPGVNCEQVEAANVSFACALMAAKSYETESGIAAKIPRFNPPVSSI